MDPMQVGAGNAVSGENNTEIINSISNDLENQGSNNGSVNVDNIVDNVNTVDTDDHNNDTSTKIESGDITSGTFGEEGDSDEEDDAVNVIIKSSSKGSIYKTGTTYQARSQQVASQGQKTLRQGININDPGNIQGVPTIEFNFTSLGDEDKPWKNPGADITDYFNYGFTEDTWLQYCEKQKILRQEYANTALKPVLVGTAASFGLASISSMNHRGVSSGVRFSQHQLNKDISILGSRGRSPSGSDEELEKRNGLLGPGQAFNMPPPPCFPPPTGGDTLSQFGNVANALNFPPPGFTNTSVPPPLLGSGFSAQQPSAQWSQTNIGTGLLPLLSGQPVRSSVGRNHHSDGRKDRTPDSLFSEEEFNDNRRSRYRADEEQESRYDRDSRSSRRSRSRSRDYRYSGRNRRYHEESSRDYNRHGERSSRRRGSRERRRERSRDRDHSNSAGNSGVAGVPVSGASAIGISVESSASRSNRSGGGSESRRRGDRESHRSRRIHRHTSHHRSPSQTPKSDQLFSESSNSHPIDPLEAASAAAADISEKIRRANTSDPGLNLKCDS